MRKWLGRREPSLGIANRRFERVAELSREIDGEVEERKMFSRFHFANMKVKTSLERLNEALEHSFVSSTGLGQRDVRKQKKNKPRISHD